MIGPLEKSRSRCHHASMTLAFVVFSLLMGNAFGLESQSGEYNVKAAFLFHFAKFVRWPAEADRISVSALTVGIVGEDPFGHALDDVVDGKRLHGRPFTIKRFGSVDDLEPCHILFVSASAARDFERILQKLGGAPVLLVGDGEGFAETGGVIELYTENRKVRFAVNPGAAERARLELSSELLSLARIANDRRSNKANGE